MQVRIIDTKELGSSVRAVRKAQGLSKKTLASSRRLAGSSCLIWRTASRQSSSAGRWLCSAP